MAARKRTPVPIQRQPQIEGSQRDSPITPTTASSDKRLLSNKEVPAWYSEPLIYTGYRPINYSVEFCFRSLAYLHNETVNIFSHLIPALVALILVGIIPWYFNNHFPEASWQDRIVFQLYLATSVICFTISALYHTLLCHSERYRDLWVRYDYTAILFQILGSFISGIYIGFYCEPTLQRLYWSMIAALSLLSAFIVLNPKFQSRKWRPVRVCSFVATGFSAFAPIIHAAIIFPYHQLDQQAGLRYYYIEGVLVLIGTFHYMSHFPEAWKPGKFDIWGASHQVFHIFVVLSAVVHFCGIMSAFRWNYENPRCPVGSQDITFG
ncbi:HlyIII-domain-containing protein [Canariomyces notabilis]|uniref:HlyIII-domain-containing protein n=1 Tax=Canariomyces notabilis TaxID=2074819 RepID=A0AAN6YU51_9PEZI|nr:HlyIII-domain-containing protein [Canariomyces arenarius]